MYLRKAEVQELDVVYSMGFEAWNDGFSFEEYLAGCRGSAKYQSGTWYVLISDDQIVSSLIVYTDMFGLKKDCFGIGSLATLKSQRNKGYATKLINLVKAELFYRHACKVIYLHSDIDHEYYQKLGFVSIKDTDCMYCSNGQLGFEHSIPAYF